MLLKTCFFIAQNLAQCQVPDDIQAALCLCKLTALKKSAQKVRGLNAADPFKRLVARTLAQQFVEEFRDAVAPFNFGIALHGGTESIMHYLQVLTDNNSQLCVTKIDGVGAFDHIFRSSMLHKLKSLPTAHRLIPFVMASYRDRSTYVWIDESNQAIDIHQGERGEQGEQCSNARPVLPWIT